MIPERFHEKENGILAYGLENGASQLIILVNLTDMKRRLKLSAEEHRKVLSVNSVRLSDTFVELGPFAGVWLQK